MIWTSGLRELGPGELIVRTARGFMAHNMNTFAAALAFRGLFALFPFILVLLALLGALGQPEFFTWLTDQAEATLPPAAFATVNQVVTEIRGGPQRGLISVGIVGALWMASVGVRSLFTAMNAAYEVTESRPIWLLVPLSILYTIGLVGVVTLTAGLMLIGPRVIQWLADHLGLTEVAVVLWTWLRWPAAILLLLIGVAVIYHLAPSVRRPFVLITPGAVLAVVIWIAATLGFTFYLESFGSGTYGATYGSLGGVIVLLLYIFISASVLLLGAEVNATIHRFGGRATSPAWVEGGEAAGARAAAGGRIDPGAGGITPFPASR